MPTALHSQPRRPDGITMAPSAPRRYRPAIINASKAVSQLYTVAMFSGEWSAWSRTTDAAWADDDGQCAAPLLAPTAADPSGAHAWRRLFNRSPPSVATYHTLVVSTLPDQKLAQLRQGLHARMKWVVPAWVVDSVAAGRRRGCRQGEGSGRCGAACRLQRGVHGGRVGGDPS